MITAPLRIAIVNLSGHPAVSWVRGLGDIAAPIGQELARMGDTVRFITTSPTEHLDLDGVQIRTLDSRAPFGSGRLRLLRNLALAYIDILRNRPFDAIYTPEIYPAALFAALTQIPVVFTPVNHSESLRRALREAGLPPTVHLRVRQMLRLRAERFTARRCSLIHAQSEDIFRAWRGMGMKSDRSITLPYGSDAGEAVGKVEARERLGIPMREQTVLYAARFSPEKNPLSAVRAVARLTGDFPDIRLRMVGDGRLQSEIEREAQSSGVPLHIHGRRPLEELGYWYAAADVFLLPSTWDLLPRVTIAAMAAGTPVVVSDTTGMAEHVRHGETGMLCDPRDVASIASAVRSLLADPAKAHSIGQAGLEYARGVFSWHRFVKELRAALVEVLGQRTDSPPSHPLR